MEIIEVDDVGAEALERLVEGAGDGFGASVEDSLAVHDVEHALAGERELRAAGHDAGDEALVGASAVQRGGVEERDAQVERAVDHPHRFALGQDPAVAVVEVHAAEADGGDRERTDLAGGECHSARIALAPEPRWTASSRPPSMRKTVPCGASAAMGTQPGLDRLAADQQPAQHARCDAVADRDDGAVGRQVVDPALQSRGDLGIPFAAGGPGGEKPRARSEIGPCSATMSR